VTKHME